MSWKKRIGSGLVLGGLAYLLLAHGRAAGWWEARAWQRRASPGRLSRAHSFLENDCAACHAPGRGPEAPQCVACHANSEALLGRAPTSFHASVGECRACHLEHRGRDRRPADMDHDALARIALGSLARPKREGLVAWMNEHGSRDEDSSFPRLTPRERLLDCAACHATKDRHFKFFGPDCARCHASSAWTIAAFRHPPPGSTDCAQCHQAPPSHYMEHFRMISASTARQPGATVDQCFLCHQTTAWNDIRGVGWYKHH